MINEVLVNVGQAAAAVMANNTYKTALGLWWVAEAAKVFGSYQTTYTRTRDLLIKSQFCLG